MLPVYSEEVAMESVPLPPPALVQAGYSQELAHTGTMAGR